MKSQLARRTACVAWLTLFSIGCAAELWAADLARRTAPVERHPQFLPASYLQQGEAPKRRSGGLHWTFSDIDVQTLLKRLERFGVNVPVPLEGRVTVRLSIGVPWRSALRPSAYELEGDLTSSALKVAGLELKKLSLHLVYTDGALQLTSMSFTVPGKDGPGGTVSGTARMQVRPPGELTAQLTIDRLRLDTLVETVPEMVGKTTGTAAGQFSGQVAVNRLRDLSAWQAHGRLTLADVHAFGLPPLRATTEFRLANGRATLTNLTAQLERARITASGDLTLAAPYAFQAQVRAAIPDLSWLNTLDPDFRPPASVAGSFTLSADADGALEPKQVRIRGALDGRNLTADAIAIERLLVPYEGTLDRIRLNGIRIELYGGQITANLLLPTDLDGNVGAGVRIRNVDLGAMAAAALNERQPWRGVASGTLQLQAPARRLQDLDAWSGQGDLSLGRGNLSGIDVSQIAANLRVENGRLVVNRLTVDSGLARVSGSAQINLTTPFGFGTALRMENVDFAQLNQVRGPFRLPVMVAGRAGISARLQGTLQPLRLTARGGVATRGLRADQLIFDSLDLNYTAESGDDLRDPASWQARLNANWSGVRVDRATLPRGALTAQLADGKLTVSRLVTEGGTTRINASARLGLVSPHEFALKLTLDNADLSIANGLPAALRPPLEVAGSVSASADLRGQLDPLQVQGNGKFGGRNLRVAGALIDSLSFNFTADNESIALSKLALTAYRGRLDGQVKFPLIETAEGDLNLRWQRVNVGRMLTDLRELLSTATDSRGETTPLARALGQTRFEGWTWGSIAIHTPAGKLLDPANWSGNFDVSLAEVRLFGLPVQKGFIKGQLADGQAELARLAFDINDARVRGTASWTLTEPYDFTSKLTVENVDLASLNKLADALRPPVKLAGAVSLAVNAEGALNPLEVTGKGSLTADKIEADGARVEHVAVEFSAEKQRIKLTRFRAELYQGQIDGTASIALEGDEAGKIDFTWRDVDLGRLATDVAHLPVSLSGKISGKLAIGIPGGKLADVAAWTVDASFETSGLTAESARVGQLSGRLTYQRGMLDYDVHGTLLRGTIELTGRWQPRPQAGSPAVNEGHFQLAAARLDALIPVLSARSTVESITGQVNVKVQYHHHDNTGLPVGAGDLAIDDLRLNGIALLDVMRGVLRVGGDRVEIANLGGVFAGGALTASAVVFFNPTRRGSFRLDIDGADLAQALAASRELASKVRGTFDAQLQGFFGGRRPVQASGAVAVRRARAAGLELSGLRLPIAAVIDPASGAGTVQMHGASGQVALGRVVGDFDLTLANGLDLTGKGKFSRLDLRTLLQQSASASRLANGKVNGSYTLAGRNVRTINDLTGTLKADLIDTQAMSLPVLQQTIPYLTGGVSGSTTFDQGTLRAHLTRGVMRIDRFSLASGSVQVFAEGTVSLAGRLDVNVMARTGQLNARVRALSLLASRIALVVSPPVGLLLEATQFLSNQVINLEVTGTIRSPTIRIRPLQLLGQEAAQFFLLQALP